MNISISLLLLLISASAVLMQDAGEDAKPPAAGGNAEGAGEIVPPTGGAGENAPPAGGAGENAPPAEGAEEIVPPAEGAGENAPPAEGAGEVAPPAEGAGEVAPPAEKQEVPEKRPAGRPKDNRKLYILPDGTSWKDLEALGEEYKEYKGHDDFSKIVANGNEIHVIHAAQQKETKKVVDPYTIGELLSYIYEVLEWGEDGPPGGFTIELQGKAKPNRARARRHSPVSKKGKLVFKRKTSPLVSDETYWNTVI